MDFEIQALKKVTRRQRDAAEQILGDSRFRDGLTDEQAKKLLNWALAYVNQQSYQTIGMPGGEADAFMDELVTAVRRVARQVNDLVAELAAFDDAKAAVEVDQFLSSLRDLTGARLRLTRFDLLAPDRQNWDDAVVFRYLINIITDKEGE